MEELTAKRREILQFIELRHKEQGFPPSVREIADAVGLASPSTVQHHLQALARAGYVHRDPAKPRALTTTQSRDRAARANMLEISETDNVVIPILGDVAAGLGTLAEERPSEEQFALPRQIVGSSDRLFVLKVRGDSMLDEGIFDGDYVVIKAQSTARDSDIVVAGVNGGEDGTVKVFRSKGGMKYLEARNSRDPRWKEPIQFDSELDQIYGVVVSLLRSYN